LNPFSRWFGRKSADSSSDVIRELLMSGSARSGVPVNWKTAMQASAAFACARVIAEGLAQVPFKLYRERPDGGRDAARDESLFELLYRKPNDFQTAYDFWEQRALHLVFCNNAFAYIVRAGNRIVELLPYEPQQVTVIRSGWEVSYQVTTSKGERIAIPASDMWHTRGPSWDGAVGLDAIKLAREAIGLSLATEKHGALLFANGAQPGGILSTEKDLSDAQKKSLKESWQEAQSGENKFKTAAMWGGMKWSPMSTPNDQAQFLETRRFQVEEICRAMRVLPIMVGHSDKTQTFASAEQMLLAHIVHTLGPWYRRCEQSADVSLLTEKQRADGMYFRFVVNALMRGAAKDRADYYTKLYNIGAINPNEIRGLEEMNPYDGGDEYRVPLNMTNPGADPAGGADSGGDADAAL
jgi:HK97 family phage portal protein